ncbi:MULTISPECIES: hypothetical protein [Streptomyces]|uniref:hypothetical protein n=1 Tax=Streptomyces TaxID=1883 RepID=UPI001670E05C|nr:hypothetical protein [Streptomyces ruber]
MQRLEDVPTVQVVGYGITRPGTHADGGVPMIRAADIQDGRLHGEELRRISTRVHDAHPRSQLRTGDLVVVLVGRVGEAAVVTRDFHGFNASRTVGIIRIADSDDSDWLRLWLRVWLGSPEVRAWCERRTTGSTLQRTLSLSVLRDLPVPLPPPAPRAPLVRALDLLEAKRATNTRIADCAMQLADTQFAVEARGGETWPVSSLGSLTVMIVGAASRPRVAENEESSENSVVLVAPADILQSRFPYLYEGEHHLTFGAAGDVCDPGSLLVASREDGVRAVVNEVPAIPGRNVLVLRTESSIDAHWLLHDIRLRSTELASAAQGSAGRELGRRAFAATMVRWPPQEVRERFARLVESLYGRVRVAQLENEKLHGLRKQILDSFLSGNFPVLPASGEHLDLYRGWPRGVGQ